MQLPGNVFASIFSEIRELLDQTEELLHYLYGNADEIWEYQNIKHSFDRLMLMPRTDDTLRFANELLRILKEVYRKAEMHSKDNQKFIRNYSGHLYQYVEEMNNSGVFDDENLNPEIRDRFNQLFNDVDIFHPANYSDQNLEYLLQLGAEFDDLAGHYN